MKTASLPIAAALLASLAACAQTPQAKPRVADAPTVDVEFAVGGVT